MASMVLLAGGHGQVEEHVIVVVEELEGGRLLFLGEVGVVDVLGDLPQEQGRAGLVPVVALGRPSGEPGRS